MSAVLIIAPPPDWLDDLGADTAPDIATALARLEKHPGQGVLLFADRVPTDDAIRFLHRLSDQAPHSPLVLVVNNLNASATLELLIAATPIAVVATDDPESIRAATRDLIEQVQLRDQEQSRIELLVDQTNRLKSLSRELEARVERRQKSLLKAKDRLLRANRRIEVLHAASLAMQRAHSLGELELALTESLKPHIGVGAVRVRFHGQSAPIASSLPSAWHQSLTVAGVTIGEITALPAAGTGFGADELDLLEQLPETVALGVDRLGKLEQAEILKQQWQATFDSISEPLCLTDTSLSILRTNRTFAAVVGQDYRSLVGKNCFAIFFSPDVATEFAGQGRAMRVRRNRRTGSEIRTYEVVSQPLHFEAIEGEVTLVMFRDITARLQIERQLLESSKMAELGLIGSSIAHELNNPLGGMLSFIQLLRMGLTGNEPYHDDILAMEAAAQKCREIVQHLLGFARRSDTTDRRKTDLREILRQSLSISELQTRSQGIVVSVAVPDKPLPLEAQPNQLSQALCNLMQNSAEAILERRRQDPRAMGTIEVKLSSEGSLYILEIHDTGVGIAAEVQDKIFNPLFTTKSGSANAGLGLTMAYKIIAEHGGKLEVFSQPGVGTTARIAFQSPDFPDQSQVFDSKI